MNNILFNDTVQDFWGPASGVAIWGMTGFLIIIIGGLFFLALYEILKKVLD